MPEMLKNLTETEVTALIGLLTFVAAAMGYFADRLIARRGVHERAAHLNVVADLRGKMAASGMSLKDIEEFEGQLRGADPATAIAIMSAAESDTNVESTDLPQQYWTTLAMNARASAQLRSLDAQLDEVLTDLETLLSGRENDALEKTQRAWRLYRDRAMAYAASEYHGGTIGPLVAVSHGATITEERIEALRADLADRKLRYG